jgi:hypothetical protein
MRVAARLACASHRHDASVTNARENVMTMHRLLATLVICVALPAGVSAKRPEPITCPDDVVTALAERCPCDGQHQLDGSVVPHKNHGQYVRCVVQFRNALRKGGCLTRELHRTIARCAARSTCGKDGLVVCCLTDMARCDDPAPGNGTPEGVCGNDDERACDVDADCVSVRGRVARDEDSCVAAGGTVAGAGSVCTACTTTTTTTAPPTTTTTLP